MFVISSHKFDMTSVLCFCLWQCHSIMTTYEFSPHQSRMFWHDLFVPASTCGPHHNDCIFSNNNAPWFSWWWDHLSWSPLFCNSDDSIQWLYWSLNVGGEASSSLQAQRFAFLSTMGFYTSFLAPEHSNLAYWIRNVDTCNILCRWLWSPVHKVTDMTSTLLILLSVQSFRDLFSLKIDLTLSCADFWDNFCCFSFCTRHLWLFSGSWHLWAEIW